MEVSVDGRSETPHIAILPSPGMGHLIPLAEFAKRLVLHHKFTVTFITADNSSKTQKAFLDALPKSVTSVALPPAPLDDLGPDVKVETRICLMVVRSLPSLRDVVRTLKKTTNLVAFVADLFGTDALDVPREFSVPPYIFFPSTAMGLCLIMHLPTLDEQTTGEYRDLPEPVRLPGCVPVHGRDLLDPIQDRKDEAYSWILHHGRRYRLADGILLNSFEEMEPGAITALRETEPPVYPIGPLIRTGGGGGGGGGSQTDGADNDPSGCLKWLDEQPRGSVLFVSFGSGGTLSSEQLRELALGLEMSRQRFLWVVRSPSEKEANANFFSVHSAKDPFAFLPEGFVQRTKDLGLVVPSWAPQMQVLGHCATGGFLTHCGWNSTLESVVHGVPMIAWPLYAEQKMNAVMLAEDVKVALRARAGEDGIVVREEVSRVVKGLMEGEEGKKLRGRVHELQEAAAKTLEEEGASYKALTQVAEKWKKNKSM